MVKSISSENTTAENDKGTNCGPFITLSSFWEEVYNEYNQYFYAQFR